MKTIKELIQELTTLVHDKGIDNALDLFSSFSKYVGQDWKQFFDKNKNEFQCSVLHRTEHLKLVLIYWNGFRKSAKHGHMKGGGLMKVLSGQVKETRFAPDDEEKITGVFNCSEGEYSYIHDALALHTVENQYAEPAISLHLYCSGVNSDFGRF